MKNFVRGFVIIALTVAVLGAVGFFGIGFYLSPQSPLSRSDAIVAISGGETDARALEAIKLYQEGWAPNIIFSGAALDPNGPSNARAMEHLALQKGVPASAISLDETALNTDQNAAGVAKIIQTNQYHKIILVTSPYHQRRASTTFRDVIGPGVVILNHSTTDKNWRRSKWWASDYSRTLTYAELQKTLYVMLTHHKA